MKTSVLQRAAQFYQNRRRKQLWYRVVSGMACVVVFCTVYALILPAITLEKETACGLEEHTHTEDCYTTQTLWPSTEYLCDEESLLGHTHDETCCDEDGALVCGYADFVVHTHNKKCCDRNGDLVCPLPEIEEHEHDRHCYRSTEVLTCGQEETGHIHGSTCYTYVRGDLCCGLEEFQGHTHGSGCYETERTLACTQEEGEEHTHDESCYETREVLTCELEESEGHAHSDACYDWTEELSCDREEDLEGHLHSADCYTTVTELVCDQAEIILHTHDESCFDEDGNLTCGKLQVLEHQHDENCAVEQEGEPEEVRVLTCGLEEHTHTDACYEEEAPLNSGTGEQAYICGLEEHTHDETCYDESGELTCTLEEHVHDETCLAVEPEDSAFPEELPEGYTEYTFESEDGLSVVAYAPENAFGGQPVTLKAEKLAEDSQGYTEAQANLEAAEDVEYDGFVALDIRFEDGDGAEVEPDTAEGRVYVKLDALALLPDDADQASVAVQHHCLEGEDPIVAAPVVQTVADGSEDTGTVEVTPTAQALMEDGEPDAALDVTAQFSVESFSTFTVTWTKNGVTATLRIHYVDELGIEIADALVDTTRLTQDRNEHDRVHSDEYAKNFISENGDGYYYIGAFTAPTDGYWVDYVTYVFSGDDQGFRCNEFGTDNWHFLGINGAAGQKGAAEADLYLRYRYLASADDTPRTVETTHAGYGKEGGQVVESGGTDTSVESDEVAVSKTLDPTDIENVFDITLRVTTKTRVEEVEKVQPLDVVIVMDISNTMKSYFSGDTNRNKRCDVAVDATSNFIRQFQQASENVIGDRRIGFVMFNTGLVEGFDLQECRTEAQAASMISQMETAVHWYRDNNDYKIANTDIGRRRFTNMETGLVKAQRMLEGSDMNNKYIIFLTDGFPTTWGLPGTSYTTDTTSTNGIEPYDSAGRIMINRTITDANGTVRNLPCMYGTSYSDTAAHWAEEHAAEARASGIKIFAIGVDVAGQSIRTYEAQDERNKNNGFSVIESIGDSQPGWRKTGKYVIDDVAGGGFTGWLENYIASGSGYYFDSDKSEELYNAFNTIFQTIKTQTEHAVSASWVAEDPITSGDRSDYIEFIRFYNKQGEPAGTALSGAAGVDGENTASWDIGTDAIDWDLKNSGYTSEAKNGVTYYTYTLKYRVRLQNELNGFVDSGPYSTNGTTALVYREVVDGSLRELKRIEFPIPQVKGYLENFRFTKVNFGDQSALAGAIFTLTHDPECKVCRGDGTAVARVGPYTATSGKDGIVSFDNVPSGHDYTLEETKAPSGYYLETGLYRVVIRYNNSDPDAPRTDAVITVTAPDGTITVMEGADSLKITNSMMYELPETGGAGTHWDTLGGLCLMAGALLLLYRTKTRGKGGKEYPC